MKIKRFIFLLEWKEWKNCWIVVCLLHKEKRRTFLFNYGVIGYRFSAHSTQSILLPSFHSLASFIKERINQSFFFNEFELMSDWIRWNESWLGVKTFNLLCRNLNGAPFNEGSKPNETHSINSINQKQMKNISF